MRIDDIRGSVTQRASGNKLPINLVDNTKQISLKDTAIVDFIGRSEQSNQLIHNISFYEKRVGMSVFLGAQAGNRANAKIIDLNIHVPKKYTIVQSFPDGATSSSDNSGAHHKWILSGSATVFGDFWVVIQDEKRKKLYEVLNFAAGALLGAAVSVIFGAFMTLITGRSS